jgi:hypothetical protein
VYCSPRAKNTQLNKLNHRNLEHGQRVELKLSFTSNGWAQPFQGQETGGIEPTHKRLTKFWKRVKIFGQHDL